jgi:hypothetical protein
MTTTIAKVIGKPNDYWVCTDCNSLNWYENEVCCDSAGMGCEEVNPMEEFMIDDEYLITEEFVDANIKKVLKYIDDEIEFYVEELEYDEDDCDNIEIDC